VIRNFQPSGLLQVAAKVYIYLQSPFAISVFISSRAYNYPIESRTDAALTQQCTDRYLFNNMPQDFTYFPKLPTELRLKVWEISMREMSMKRRLITIKPRKHGLYSPEGRLPSPLLQVCRESRYQALSRYNAPKNLGSPYISYAHDSICIQRDNCEMTIESAIVCLKPELHKIQPLVVDMDFFQLQRSHPDMRSNVRKLLFLIRRHLTELRELIFTPMPCISIYNDSGFMDLAPKQVITLKNVRLLEKEPLGGYYLRFCEGEVDKCPDMRRWIAYPNVAWEFAVNYLRHLDREKGYPSGPSQLDYRWSGDFLDLLRGYVGRCR
jgi:2EXR family